MSLNKYQFLFSRGHTHKGLPGVASSSCTNNT